MTKNDYSNKDMLKSIYHYPFVIYFDKIEINENSDKIDKIMIATINLIICKLTANL